MRSEIGVQASNSKGNTTKWGMRKWWASVLQDDFYPNSKAHGMVTNKYVLHFERAGIFLVQKLL